MVLLCTSESVRPSFQDPDRSDEGMDRGHRSWSPIQRFFFSQNHQILSFSLSLSLSGDKDEPYYGCCLNLNWKLESNIVCWLVHSGSTHFDPSMDLGEHIPVISFLKVLQFFIGPIRNPESRIPNPHVLRESAAAVKGWKQPRHGLRLNV